MSEFNYEQFLNQCRQNGLILDECKDISEIFGELYTSDVKLRSSQKNKLNHLQNTREVLEEEHLSYNSFNKELFQLRVAMASSNSKVQAEIKDAEKRCHEVIKQHVRLMKDLDKQSYEFSADEDSENLKDKITDLKSTIQTLQDQYDRNSVVMADCLKSMEHLNVPIPNIEQMKKVRADVLNNSVDISLQEEKLANIIRFKQELESKINT